MIHKSPFLGTRDEHGHTDNSVRKLPPEPLTSAFLPLAQSSTGGRVTETSLLGTGNCEHSGATTASILERQPQAFWGGNCIKLAAAVELIFGPSSSTVVS